MNDLTKNWQWIAVIAGLWWLWNTRPQLEEVPVDSPIVYSARLK